MDEITLLRRLREDRNPTDESVTRGRAALFNKINEVAPKERVTTARRRFTLAGLGAAGAFAIVGVLVATNVLGFGGWRGGADAAAAAILERAAIAAFTFDDVPLAAGQYLHVSSQTVHVTDGQEQNGPVIAFRIKESSELYVPEDRADDWVWVRDPISVIDVLSPGGEDMVERSFPSSEQARDPELLRAPFGAFYGNTAESQWGDFASMPRDPYRLLNHIYLTTIGAGSSPDGEALVVIADTLRQGTAPADLRAALLRAAAMIPGVTITDDQATLDGQTGTAIGRVESENGLRQEIIIDPTSGRLIGEREVAVVAIPESSIAAGDVWRWSSVHTSIVDAAPAGGTPNGASDLAGCVPGERTGEMYCPPGGKK